MSRNPEEKDNGDVEVRWRVEEIGKQGRPGRTERMREVGGGMIKSKEQIETARTGSDKECSVLESTSRLEVKGSK